MTPGSSPSKRQTPPRGFATWAWFMLVVVLLSAVPSGGQARTRLVGSAFDPTTVSVALSPKQPKAKAALDSPERRRLPDTGSGGPGALLALAAPAGGALARPAEAGPSPFARPTPAARPRMLAGALGPRAPPAA